MKQYHPYNYTTLKESGRSASSMTSEYSQMRKIALGRIARLQKNSLEGYSTKYLAGITDKIQIQSIHRSFKYPKAHWLHLNPPPLYLPR